MTKKLTQLLKFLVICTLLGILLGALMITLEIKGIYNFQPLISQFNIGVFIFSTILSFIASVALHEVGHMIGGLLSGYEFIELSILGLTWGKDHGEITFKHNLKENSLIGGKCAMSPPPLKNNRFPVAAYYLGGVVSNVILAILGVVLLVTNTFAYSFEIGLSLSLINAISAFLNGIPNNNETLFNDGRQLQEITRNDESYYAAYYNLVINARFANGENLNDLSDEYLSHIEDNTASNYYVASLIQTKALAFLIDNKINQSYTLLSEREDDFMHLPTVMKMMILLELSYLRLVYDFEGTLYFQCDQSDKILKGMGNSRILYAKALLIDGNNTQAELYKKLLIKEASDINTPQYIKDFIHKSMQDIEIRKSTL